MTGCDQSWQHRGRVWSRKSNCKVKRRAPCANISFVTVATLSAADTALGVMVTS
jgi:hypothetical protein